MASVAHRRYAALAVAALLGCGLTACSDDDKKSDGAAGKGAKDPAVTAYTDQLLAHLKTTSQGAHVLKAEAFEEEGDLFVNVDTDLPYFADGDMSDPAQDAQDRLDKLARESEDWAADTPDGPGIQLIAINPLGYRGNLKAAEIAVVPKHNQEYGKRVAYAERLLAHLKATAQGVGVTRATLDMVLGEGVIALTTDLPSHTTAEYSTDGARQARATAETLARAALAWTTANPEYKVSQVAVEDREKSTLTVESV